MPIIDNRILAGTRLSVTEDQTGANPRLVTETEPLPVALCNNQGETVVEQYSNAVHTIEQEHAQIHAGTAYSLSGVMDSIASGASAYFYLDPVSPVHFRYYKLVADGGPFDIELYENPTVTALGTPVTPINRNRFSSNTSDASIYVNPTVTADGTFLDMDRAISTGTGANAAGELEDIGAEWIIDNGNTYMFKITNNDNGPITPIYRFFFYH